MTRFTFDYDIERDDETVEVRVCYDVTPFIEATYWQPAEGGEVEITGCFPAGSSGKSSLLKASRFNLSSSDASTIYEILIRHK